MSSSTSVRHRAGIRRVAGRVEDAVRAAVCPGTSWGRRRRVAASPWPGSPQTGWSCCSGRRKPGRRCRGVRWRGARFPPWAGWVLIGSVYSIDSQAGSLDEYLKRFLGFLRSPQEPKDPLPEHLKVQTSLGHGTAQSVQVPISPRRPDGVHARAAPHPTTSVRNCRVPRCRVPLTRPRQWRGLGWTAADALAGRRRRRAWGRHGTGQPLCSSV